MTKPRPLESFAPELLRLLLRAALEPQALYAEADKAAPKLLPKQRGNTVLAASAVETRWHTVVFSTPAAAKRFRELKRIAKRLNELRLSMKYFDHPATAKVYAVRVSLDDRLGRLYVAPADAGLIPILNEAENEKNSLDEAGAAASPDPLDALDSNV